MDLRLARAPDLPVRSKAGRFALICLAALTPLVSYYAVGAARRVGSARQDGPARLVPVVPLVLFVALSIDVAIRAALLEETSPRVPNIWRIASNGLILTGLWVLIIYMIVRVLSKASIPRSIAITLAIMALSIAFMAAVRVDERLGV